MDGTAFLPVPWKKMVVPSGTICGIVLDQRGVDRRSLRSGTNLWARSIHCATVNGMSGTRPYLAVQGEPGTAQQNHPNRFLRLLSSAYADSFTGGASVARLTPVQGRESAHTDLRMAQNPIPVCS